MAKKNPNKTIHLGTFREMCAQHGCPGCPTKRSRKNPHETKTHNYLLRSTYRDNLLNLMALVHVARVRVGGHGFPIIVKADGTWAGNAGLVLTLENRGFIRKITYMDGVSVYELTTYGHAALDGALFALGRRLDTAALLSKIDAREIL